MVVLRGKAPASVALAATVLACATAADAAQGAGVRPGSPPDICDGDLFADQIGTARPDLMRAPARAERLWGLQGPDRLIGSSTRATCLFGGGEGDVLDLRGGGGAAWGQAGADTITGSALADRVDGGAGRDAVDAGAGNDEVDVLDGQGEVVHCGLGHDLAEADRSDVLIGCDVAVTSGPSTPLLAPRPRAADASGIVRITFKTPEAAGPGAYRVLLVTGARGADCADGPLELTRLPEPGERVRRGQTVRVGLRPPQAGWCDGVTKAAVILHRRCRVELCAVQPPGEPLARVRFSSGAPH